MVLIADIEMIGLIILSIVIMLSPAIILTIIGFNLKKRKPETSKVLFIIATVYAIVGLGICGVLLSM